MKLYEISEEMLAILEDVDVETGEMTEEQVTALQRLEGKFEAKAENVAKYIRNIEGEAEVFRAEAERLARKARTRKNTSARLKLYLLDNMRVAGVTKIKGKVLSVAVQKSPASVSINDEGLVPREYWHQPAPTIDKARVRDALKNGEHVPGAVLVASEHVRIR